jgi:hypothetical protein
MNRIKKRSVIPADRLEELRSVNAIYEVRCGISGCPCANPGDYCGRGFFSLFIQAIYGIEFAGRVQIPYHINFGNCTYPYTDVKNARGGNFWNYYFKQPVTEVNGSHRQVVNDFMEIYPLRIWNRAFIRRMYHSVVKHMEFTEEVRSVFKTVSENFNGSPVIGVHIRRTDHHDEIPHVKIENYIKAIDSKLKKGDRVFLATDDTHVVDLLKEKYGHVLLTNDVLRSSGTIGTHSSPGITDKFRLGLDALLDCYSLSLCREAILTQSNLSYAAVLFNPELKFVLMERPETTIRRLKTLLVYNLDQWGIRKW